LQQKIGNFYREMKIWDRGGRFLTLDRGYTEPCPFNVQSKGGRIVGKSPGSKWGKCPDGEKNIGSGETCPWGGMSPGVSKSGRGSTHSLGKRRRGLRESWDKKWVQIARGKKRLLFAMS